MTRLGRLFRNLVERLLGRYYEGPEPPRSIGDEVRMFCHFYPTASRRQWEAFALRLAGNAYRSGFTRGLEWQERGWEGPAIDPERLAEVEAHDWSLADAGPEYAALLGPGGEQQLEELERTMRALDQIAGRSVEVRRGMG